MFLCQQDHIYRSYLVTDKPISAHSVTAWFLFSFQSATPFTGYGPTPCVSVHFVNRTLHIYYRRRRWHTSRGRYSTLNGRSFARLVFAFGDGKDDRSTRYTLLYAKQTLQQLSRWARVTRTKEKLDEKKKKKKNNRFFLSVLCFSFSQRFEDRPPCIIFLDTSEEVNTCCSPSQHQRKKLCPVSLRQTG